MVRLIVGSLLVFFLCLSELALTAQQMLTIVSEGVMKYEYLLDPETNNFLPKGSITWPFSPFDQSVIANVAPGTVAYYGYGSDDRRILVATGYIMANTWNAQDPRNPVELVSINDDGIGVGVEEIVYVPDQIKFVRTIPGQPTPDDWVNGVDYVPSAQHKNVFVPMNGRVKLNEIGHIWISNRRSGTLLFVDSLGVTLDRVYTQDKAFNGDLLVPFHYPTKSTSQNHQLPLEVSYVRFVPVPTLIVTVEIKTKEMRMLIWRGDPNQLTFKFNKPTIPLSAVKDLWTSFERPGFLLVYIVPATRYAIISVVPDLTRATAHYPLNIATLVSRRGKILEKIEFVEESVSVKQSHINYVKFIPGVRTKYVEEYLPSPPSARTSNQNEDNVFWKKKSYMRTTINRPGEFTMYGKNREVLATATSIVREAGEASGAEYSLYSTTTHVAEGDIGKIVFVPNDPSKKRRGGSPTPNEGKRQRTF